VDKALSAAFPEHSRSEFQRAIDAGLVTRAGAALERSSLVRAGDTLAFSFPDTAPAALRPVAIHLDILYEDAWLVAVNKPAGMVVHPGAATGEDTLVHALLAHCGASLSGIGGVERPGIVHRLDRETSGVVIAAKNDRAHRALAAQFAERTARKEYRALVAGIPRLMSGSVRKAIGRNPRHRHKMAALEDGGGGRPAWTDWELVERFGERAALLSLALHTGRTHQIRVHMASMGHPILGDVTYGWKPDGRGEQPGRTLLHAARLRVAHPVGGRILDLKAPLPPDFLRQLRLLRRPA
jgi:23S rRNA pseudouridine1911/1915/1917 synthase